MVMINQPPPSAPERGYDGYIQPTTSIMIPAMGVWWLWSTSSILSL